MTDNPELYVETKAGIWCATCGQRLERYMGNVRVCPMHDDTEDRDAQYGKNPDLCYQPTRQPWRSLEQVERDDPEARDA